MKKSLLAGVVLTIAFCTQSHAQFTFGVSPGLNLNSAHFGYRAEKFVPFLGFQFANGKVDYQETGSFFGNQSSEQKATIFMPTLGLKYFAIERGEVQGYILGSITKPFISAESKDNGVNDPNATEVINDVKVWAGQVGVGAEYFFSDNFSVGGEFGIMFLSVNSEDSYEEFSGPGPDPTTVNTTTKIGVNPTYSKISLNFYF